MDNVLSLDELFHKRIFQVPDYQRGYSWEKQQIDEFIDDLELLEPNRFHYTGTIVLDESNMDQQTMDDHGNTYSPVWVVDGQQRLTTIVLFLDAIRHFLAMNSEPASRNLAKGIRTNYICADGMDGQPLYKLSLNSDANHYFQKSVLSEQGNIEPAKITSERRLSAATTRFSEYLSEETNRSAGALGSLHRKLTTQLRFTLYRVTDRADVGVIFEVMNDRGRPLTDLEKVKNYLLHAAASLGVVDGLGTAVNSAWALILRQLMAADLVLPTDEDRLLRAHWLVYYDARPRQWHGSKSVKAKFDLRRRSGEQKQELLESLERYTERLRTACITFCDAYQPHRHDAFQSFDSDVQGRMDVIEWSSKLCRVGVVAPFLPLLLAVRDRWPSDCSKYLDVVQLCEAFAFRVYRMKGSRSDAGQVALFHLAFEVAREHLAFEDIEHTIKSELWRLCGDHSFEQLMSPDFQQNWYDWPGVRYFLFEYEIAIAQTHGASPRVTWNEIGTGELKNTVEHILPQSMGDRSYWHSRFNEESHKAIVHDLGNLTLTKHNPQYGNKPFPEKRDNANGGACYRKSPLYCERELCEWEEWNPDSIQHRRDRLVDWAMRRWAVDLNDVQPMEGLTASVDEGIDVEADVLSDD